jgi:hypothetical protein
MRFRGSYGEVNRPTPGTPLTRQDAQRLIQTYVDHYNAGRQTEIHAASIASWKRRVSNGSSSERQEGDEDLNDHEELRHDPLLGLLSILVAPARQAAFQSISYCWLVACLFRRGCLISQASHIGSDAALLRWLSNLR